VLPELPHGRCGPFFLCIICARTCRMSGDPLAGNPYRIMFSMRGIGSVRKGAALFKGAIVRMGAFSRVQGHTRE